MGARVRVCVPPPQVLLHVDQAPHGSHALQWATDVLLVPLWPYVSSLHAVQVVWCSSVYCPRAQSVHELAPLAEILPWAHLSHVACGGEVASCLRNEPAAHAVQSLVFVASSPRRSYPSLHEGPHASHFCLTHVASGWNVPKGHVAQLPFIFVEAPETNIPAAQQAHVSHSPLPP